MADIDIYSSGFCGFCYRAKSLLKGRGVAFNEIDVDTTPGARQEMMQRTGGSTSVPQIFIDGVHVGGSEELAALDRDGGLDAMLGTG